MHYKSKSFIASPAEAIKHFSNSRIFISILQLDLTPTKRFMSRFSSFQIFFYQKLQKNFWSKIDFNYLAFCSSKVIDVLIEKNEFFCSSWFSGLVFTNLMASYELLLGILLTSYELLMSFLWASYELLMNFLWLLVSFL